MLPTHYLFGSSSWYILENGHDLFKKLDQLWNQEII